MKVLLVSPLPPPAGGIGTWTKRYLDNAQKYNIEVNVVNTAPIGKRATQVNGKRRVEEVKRTIKIISDLRNKIRNNKYDIIHLNTSCERMGMLRDYICITIAKKSNIPIVLHIRRNLPSVINSGYSRRLFGKIAKKADYVITLNKQSHDLANEFIDFEAVTIPNFIDEGFADNIFLVRDQISIILFVGHVQFAKGFREAVEAAKNFPQIEFIFIGPLRDEINTLNLPDNVILKGELPYKDVKDYLKDTDVFLFPSYTEGFANALLEAMAYGVPCIASDVGANLEMIENKGGIVVPAQDAAAIVEAIKKMESVDNRRKMSVWNQEKVKREYTISSVMNRLYDVYEKLMWNEEADNQQGM